VAEGAIQPPRRRAGARAGLGGRRFAPLGIIRRLRHHSDRAARYCAAGANASESMMSHSFFRGRPLTTALAVSTLSRRMVQRSAAAPLIARRGPTQLLTPTHLLAVPWAIRLSALTPAADPNGDPAAPAVVPPIRSHPHAPRAQRWTAPGGSRHIGPAAKPPQAHRNAGGPGSEWYRSPGPRFYADKHSETASAPGSASRSRSITPGENCSPIASIPLGGSEAAGGGRLRPAQPALSIMDAHDLINGAALARCAARYASAAADPHSNTSSTTTVERTVEGGLLLASKGGLNLDSASGQD
jgi:hypothetical protein